MLRKWADSLDRLPVRLVLIAVGLLVSLPLGWLALLGVVTTYDDLRANNLTSPSTFLLGTCGLLAMLAAWLRLVLPRSAFTNNMLLRHATTSALAVGIVVALVLFIPSLAGSNSAFLLVAPVIPIGIYLCGATLGAAAAR